MIAIWIMSALAPPEPEELHYDRERNEVRQNPERDDHGDEQERNEFYVLADVKEETPKALIRRIEAGLGVVRAVPDIVIVDGFSDPTRPTSR